MKNSIQLINHIYAYTFFYTDSCSATVFYFHSEVKTYWWGRDQDFFYVQNETEIKTFLELYILDRKHVSNFVLQLQYNIQ